MNNSNYARTRGEMTHKFIAFLLCLCAAPLGSYARNVTHNPRACDQHTTGYNYTLFETLPVITHGIHLEFSVITPSDALLLLTINGDVSLRHYEIHLGGAGNTVSSIRDSQAGLDVVRVNTVGLLDQYSYKSFWFRYLGGVIEVGQTGNTIPFLSYHVGDYGFNTVGFSSWAGTSAKWMVYTGENAENFETTNYAYTHYTLAVEDAGNIHLQFALKAASDALVLLSRVPFPSVGSNVYEILIGSTSRGLAQMHTSVRKLQGSGQELGAIVTPGIVDPLNYKCFWLDVSSGGIISLGTVGDSVPLFQYTDTTSPISVAYYAFSSDYVYSADWRSPCEC